MSTKLIAALIILFVVRGGYGIFTHDKEVQEQRWLEKEESSGNNIARSKLEGLPYPLAHPLAGTEPPVLTTCVGGEVVRMEQSGDLVVLTGQGKAFVAARSALTESAAEIGRLDPEILKSCCPTDQNG